MMFRIELAATAKAVIWHPPPCNSLTLFRPQRSARKHGKDQTWGPITFPNLLKVAGPFRFSATWPRTMLRQPRKGTIQERIPRAETSPHVASPVRPALASQCDIA